MTSSLNLNNKLRYFAEVLSNATARAWHYTKPERERFPYAIWTEYSEDGSMPANNRKKIQPIITTSSVYICCSAETAPSASAERCFSGLFPLC